jgi:plastocyanin
MLKKSAMAAFAGLLLVAAPALADSQSVQVGGSVTGKPQIDLQGFFPKKPVIHVGDTVHFDFAGFHTVAVLPDGAVPNPPFVPSASLNVSTNDGAGVPFWWSLAPTPQLQLDPLVFGPSASASFDGTAQVNSGAPTGFPFSYDVTFTTAGTFRIVCELHPYMTGKVVVADASATIPSQADQAAAAQRQINRATKQAIRMDAALSHHAGGDHAHGEKGHSHGKGGHTVIAGDGKRNFSLLAFYPQTLTVKAGQKVTWVLKGWDEPHTITIGPESVLGPLDAGFLGGPPNFYVDSVGAYPTEAPGAPVIHTDTVHGNGLLGAGVLFDKPKGKPDTWTVQFNTPGTYTYECLIHNGMDGTIIVTDAGSHGGDDHHHH